MRLDTGGGGVELKGTGETPGDGDDIVRYVSGEWYFVVRERGVVKQLRSFYILSTWVAESEVEKKT